MESKQSRDYYYYVAMAGPAIGTGKPLKMAARPRRGSIKRKIFASIAESILEVLKRIGATLAEFLHCAMAASACNICCSGKVTSTASAMDLLRTLMP